MELSELVKAFEEKFGIKANVKNIGEIFMKEVKMENKRKIVLEAQIKTLVRGGTITVPCETKDAKSIVTVTSKFISEVEEVLEEVEFEGINCEPDVYANERLTITVVDNALEINAK